MNTAFERLEDGWIYYRRAWSRGVRVTREERDLFCSFRPLAFRRAIADRLPSEPRRPYWPTLRRLLTAMLTGRDPREATL